jgi:hypothetical protein
MPKYVAPLAKRKTFSDAIASAVPVYLQTQQQLRQQEMMNQRMAMQQEQFERSLAERTQARLDQAEKANQAQAYKAQKELEKTYKERTSEIYGFDTSNLNESQAAVIKVLVQDGMQHLGDNEMGWQQALNNVEEYIDLFTATESDLEEREATFSQYALEGKDYADPTMEFIGDEFKMNQYRSVRNLGGIDIETIDLVDGVPVADYLGPDGKKLINQETKTVMSGPIKDAPYYNPANRSALYSIDGNLVERSNVSAADFLIGFEEQLAVINSDTTLTADQKKDKVKQLLLSGFEDRENLSNEFKLGYSSAIRAYDQSRLNKNKPMTTSEIDEAVNSYIDKVVDLYQPERSLIETELDYNNYFEQRLSKIANDINRRDDLTREQKINEFVKRSDNVFRTGSDDLDKRARATAEDVWKSNNTGADYNESEAYKNYMSEVFERAEVMFEEQKPETERVGRGPSATEVRQANQAQQILGNPVPANIDPVALNQETLMNVNLQENIRSTSFQIPDFGQTINLSNYLPESITREEPIVTTNYETGEKTVTPGEFKKMNDKPTQVTTLIDNNGDRVLMLSGFSDPNIPPVFINVSQNTPFVNQLNTLFNKAYGAGNVSVEKLFEQHAKSLL